MLWSGSGPHYGLFVLQPAPPVTEEDQAQGQELRESFKRIAGEDLEVDAYELREILNAVFTKGMPTLKVNCSSFYHVNYEISK